MSDDLRERVALAVEGMDTSTAEGARAVADAALAKMGGVRVRELEWTWHTIPRVWQARSMVGVYEVDTHGSWRLTREGVNGWVMRGGKEAAEADHRRRILAAIEPAPAKGKRPPASADWMDGPGTGPAPVSAQEGALIEATDYARNRLEHIASASWNGDGRDLKRSIQGIFVEYDEALRAIAEGKDDER